MAAHSIIEWNEFNISHHQDFSETLDWRSFGTILRAAHNIRACGSKDKALDEIVNGVYGDMITIMGYFPYLAHDTKVDDPIAARGSYPGQNTWVANYFDIYVKPHTAGEWDTAWNTFVQDFENQCRPTDGQKTDICRVFQKRITEFFRLGLLSIDTPAWVMIRPDRDNVMARMDPENSSGIGKMRNLHLQAAQYSRQVLALDGLKTEHDKAEGDTKEFLERLKTQLTIAMNGLIFMCQRIVVDKADYAGRDI